MSPYTGPVELSGDGERVLAYRSTDVAGNLEAAKELRVTLDSTAQVLVVSGIADGRSYGDSLDLVLGVQASDPGGVTLMETTLYGEAVEPGPLVLHELDLGIHSVVVVAEDAAGNRSTQTVRFVVSTSFSDVSRLLTRFDAEDRLSAGDTRSLLRHLDKAAKAAAGGSPRGDDKAVDALRAFQRDVTRAGADATVTRVLDRDAEAIIDQLTGRPLREAG